MVIENYEEVHVYPLAPDVQEELLRAQNECTFIWCPKDGWAVGVIMSYVWRDGRFWLTATSQRKRIAAVRRDDRVSIVVSSAGAGAGAGTGGGGARSITAKGRCRLRDDQETKDWFYPALAEAILPEPGPVQQAFARTLDSPRRLIFEVTPEKFITFDGVKMMMDSIESWQRPDSPVRDLFE